MPDEADGEHPRCSRLARMLPLLGEPAVSEGEQPNRGRRKSHGAALSRRRSCRLDLKDRLLPGPRGHPLSPRASGGALHGVTVEEEGSCRTAAASGGAGAGKEARLLVSGDCCFQRQWSERGTAVE